MKKGDKIGIVACSNGIDKAQMPKIEELIRVLQALGIEPVISDHIYDQGFGFSGTGKERSRALMDFYEDDAIKAIFDISGGDIGNQVLLYLDFEKIALSGKEFWGYSDLTTIINAIYAKTGKSSALYQVRNLVNADWENQRVRFEKTVLHGENELYDLHYDFMQGKEMQGILVGGNIRCLLKLAGTEYWPDMKGKILFLEARSGKIPQIVTYFSQLKQLGVFEQISGLFLGTFTELARNAEIEKLKEIITDLVDEELPIAVTEEVGHGADSKALVIGGEYYLK